MNRAALALLLLLPAARLAADPFSRDLSPEDFAAAGLGKLTPDELAKLDALVQSRQSGAVTAAKESVSKEAAATVRAQVRAGDAAAAPKPAPGFLDRVKVILRPGTEIEYTTLDSSIAPPFGGWHRGTVITLENGQRWVVTDDDDFYGPVARAPVRARIVPGSMGSFFIEIEGFGKARVRFLGGGAAPARSP
jgi:hypothetical protein